jgi:RNA polymerase sigma-70 factor (ECF subfamily)
MIALRANGGAAFAQYKPAAEGRWEPWALQVVEVRDGKITGIHHWIPPFAEKLFEQFGVPPYLEGDVPYSSERASSSS